MDKITNVVDIDYIDKVVKIITLELIEDFDGEETTYYDAYFCYELYKVNLKDIDKVVGIIEDGRLGDYYYYSDVTEEIEDNLDFYKHYTLDEVREQLEYCEKYVQSY